MTTFYYAVGGGLGHLTRARRVLEALALRHDAVIIASCPDPGRISGGIPVICVPTRLEGDREGHRRWIDLTVRAHRAEHMIVDAFPAGIQGELIGLRGVALDHVARLLRWDEYLRRVGSELLHFETTYLVEPLAASHAAWVAAHSRCVAALDLGDVVARDAQVDSGEVERFWLIVHSGPAAEVEELVAWTAELMSLQSDKARVLVATTEDVRLPEGFERTGTYPASRLFAAAARIISAAGFNVMMETEAWRAKHDIMPLPRRFDDQFARAARRRVSAPVPVLTPPTAGRTTPLS